MKLAKMKPGPTYFEKWAQILLFEDGKAVHITARSWMDFGQNPSPKRKKK